MTQSQVWGKDSLNSIGESAVISSRREELIKKWENRLVASSAKFLMGYNAKQLLDVYSSDWAVNCCFTVFFETYGH